MTKGLLESRWVVASLALLAGVGMGWVSRDISQPPSVPANVANNAANPQAVGRSQSTSSSFATSEGGAADGGSMFAVKSTNAMKPSVEDTRRAEADGILKNLITEMEKGDKLNYRQLFKTLGQLRDFGPEGVAVIAGYLRSGEDLVVTGAGSSGRSMSLRSLLLNAMGEMPASPELAALNMEIMKGTPLIEEAALAAYNLHRMAPGEYTNAAAARINWLLENMSSNTAVNTSDAMERELRYAAQFASYTGSAETLALLTRQAIADPAMARTITSSLRKFPAETQAATLASMTSSPAASKEVAANSRALTRLDLSNNSVRTSVADLFINQMSDRSREDFLESIVYPDSSSSWRDGGSRWSYFRDQGGGQVESAATKAAKNQGTLQLLDQINSAIRTPVLQQRYEEARQALIAKSGAN